MRKIVSVVIALLLLGIQVMAQNRTITGRVTDANNNPLPNISVTVKGTRTGTTTKADGTFSISAPERATALVFSGVGFTAQEVAIGNKTSISVNMAAAATDIQEVVVVGYQQRKKRDEAGAISSVRGKDIENIPNVSVDKALQGRATGVLVQSNNGIPGGAINVRIRGTGSIQAGNQPLYIVDGVPINARNDANFTQSNPLAFLNPNDIESIDVLKDAASAAIYGAQASNGVVIVTTKKGKAGKTKFTFNTYAGVTQPLQKLDVLNSQEWVQMRTEAYMNFASVSATTVSPLIGATPQQAALIELRVPGAASMTPAQADAATAALQNTDWQDAVFKSGVLQNYELSASGGNDRTQFYTSASYNRQDAIINKVDFERGTLKLDVTNKVNDKVSFNTSINLSTFRQRIPFSVDGSFLGSPAFSSSLMLPSNPIYNSDGSFFGVPPANVAGILNQNIVAVNDFNTGFQRTNQMIGNLSFDYKITKWLTFRSFYGMDYRLVQGKSVRDSRTPDAFARRGLVQTQSNWNTNFLTTQTFSYNKNFGERHRLDGILGIEYRREANEGITASGDGFPSFQFTTLNAAANPVNVGEFYTAYKLFSGLGAVNYNYDSRYLVSFVFRYGGSSRFGDNFKYGFFPGVKVAWNISREKFMERSNFINDLKLRASWGQTGNDQIGNFDGLGLYGAGTVYNGAAGINPTQLPNPDLRWEKNETSNIGIDYTIWNNRISGSIDVYQKLTKDLLLNQPVQWTTGYGSYTSNVGQVENRGVEFGIQANLIRSRKADGFRWTTNFNFTYNKNKVKQLYGGFQVLPSDVSIRVGYPIGTVFTQTYAGVNPATGRPMWLDTLGNLTYAPIARDRRIAGDLQPEYFGGMNNSFQYKGFTLDVFFAYEYGRVVSDGQVNFLLENGNRTFNGLQLPYDNRWRKPGDITMYPRPYVNGAESKGVNHMIASTRTNRKADYVRLKNITFSYDLKTELARKLRINNARIYVQATNLWTYADWLGYDPEFVDSGNGNGVTGIIPQSKNVTFGIQVGF
jgi:TonB-linked SusC/RagA family outer membrane protein